MQYVVTNAQMKNAERECDRAGTSYFQMMENAGTACAEYISGLITGGRTVILCGAGNNGGDGLVIARLLHEKGLSVSVAAVCGAFRTECAQKNQERLQGVSIFPMEQAAQVLSDADCVVDCIFGTGFHGRLSDTAADIISVANKCAVRVAVDVPSGVDSDTGERDERCFMPTHTLVLAAMKQGLIGNTGCSDILGEVSLLDIGIGERFFEGNNVAFLADESLRRPFPPHGRDTHKGTFGRLISFAGSLHFSGAAFMCASAALRSGVGLYFAAAPESTVKILASTLHEAVYSPMPEDGSGFMYFVDEAQLSAAVIPVLKKASAVIIGCGLGNTESTRLLTKFVIKNAACPVVIDADGINSISENIDVLKERTGDTILTPHPLEFSRMTGIKLSEIQYDRLGTAREAAQRLGAVVLLKGADTVIAAPDGRICVKSGACRGLSKGGSGDVLTGIIGAFSAQGIDCFTAACAGAYCHWKAAAILSQRMPGESILPTDVISALPEVYSAK